MRLEELRQALIEGENSGPPTGLDIDAFIADKLEQARIKQSAELYAEIYDGDDELRGLTESAPTGWPE